MKLLLLPKGLKFVLTSIGLSVRQQWWSMNLSMNISGLWVCLYKMSLKGIVHSKNENLTLPDKVCISIYLNINIIRTSVIVVTEPMRETITCWGLHAALYLLWRTESLKSWVSAKSDLLWSLSFQHVAPRSVW